MGKKISIIGGDLRIVKLLKLLENEGFDISCFGLEKVNNNNKSNSLESCLENSEIVISAIPFSKDDKYINAPFSDCNIEILQLFEIIKNVKFIAGAINNQLIKNVEKSKNIEFVDILLSERFAIKNAIPSAEGAIQIAMEQSDKTLHGNNVLVMGFGRIGKILAKMLNGIGANVYCEARKKEDIAWIEAYGYNAIELKNLKNNLFKFDFIFNTIPVVILDENNLREIKKECVIIDLASKPGGINYEVANQFKIKNIWALGLPGKVAPETVAKYIKEELNLM